MNLNKRQEDVTQQRKPKEDDDNLRKEGHHSYRYKKSWSHI